MNINKIQSHIDSLTEEELLLFVGEWVLSESITLGAQPPSAEDMRHAALKFLQIVCTQLSQQLKHPLAETLTKPGPIGAYIDFLGGSYIEHLPTEVKIVAYAAMASRYGLPKLIDRFARREGDI